MYLGARQCAMCLFSCGVPIRGVAGRLPRARAAKPISHWKNLAMCNVEQRGCAALVVEWLAMLHVEHQEGVWKLSQSRKSGPDREGGKIGPSGSVAGRPLQSRKMERKLDSPNPGAYSGLDASMIFDT
jgi:hypothetical protein